MEVSIVQMGDSKGLHLSTDLLKRYNIREKVTLTLKEDCIILKPVAVRQGWNEACAEMHDNGDDNLLIDPFFTDEILNEW